MSGPTLLHIQGDVESPNKTEVHHARLDEGGKDSTSENYIHPQLPPPQLRKTETHSYQWE